jgi:hypothetical protein
MYLVMKTKKEKQTHFVTANITIVYEVFTDSKGKAEIKFMEAFENLDERAEMVRDCILEIEKVENAHEHLGDAE